MEGCECGSGLGTVAAHSGANGSRPGSRSVSSHLNNFLDLHDNSLLSEDPEGNKVRSLHFTQLSLSYHMSLEVSRGANETRLRPDAHDVGLRPPCRTRALRCRGEHHITPMYPALSLSASGRCFSCMPSPSCAGGGLRGLVAPFLHPACLEALEQLREEGLADERD